MRRWKLEDAKNRFSDVVRRAQGQGPQLVTRNGKDAVVVLSIEDYGRLTAPDSLVDFLAASPLADALRDGALDLERRAEAPRDLAL